MVSRVPHHGHGSGHAAEMHNALQLDLPGHTHKAKKGHAHKEQGHGAHGHHAHGHHAHGHHAHGHHAHAHPELQGQAQNGHKPVNQGTPPHVNHRNDTAIEPFPVPTKPKSSIHPRGIHSMDDVANAIRALQLELAVANLKMKEKTEPAKDAHAAAKN
jgi:hypothetical protein